MDGIRRPVMRAVAVAWVASLALSACALFEQDQHYASSVVDYLYAGEVGTVQEPGIPVLRLPLRVGIGFVPTQWGRGSEVISEKERIELMRQIAPSFEELEFVDSIAIIPSAYMRPGGGFTNLDQLRTMFGIDVIALLSYDQAQFTGEGWDSISYWTLVGAYVVRGEKNDTHTMIDAAVYDIASRKLLFRAPGVSEIKGRATPVGLEDKLRRDRERGFEQAAADLVPNLRAQLDLFREDVKNERTKAEIIRSPGYAGGGRIDLYALAGLVTIGLIYRCLRGRRSS